MREQVHQKLPHERLDIYGVYLETASFCADIVANVACPIVALDHLDRAMESIGVNLMRGNGQPAGSAARANYLDVSIGSTHECAVSLDVCLARCVVDESAHTAGTENLWRIRGMLLGLKRASISRAVREEHAFQTLLMLDLMAARKETTESRIAEGKAAQVRVITMLHAWCERNEQRNDQHASDRLTRAATRADHE